MFKKLILMVLAVLCQVECVASFGKRSSGQELKRMVIFPPSYDLDAEIVPYGQVIDIGSVKKDEEDYSCWKCLDYLWISFVYMNHKAYEESSDGKRE
ncbi:MAG: hypothetical protein NTZ68_04315 [Candidatus Dependentiae bacterium]|nr:hypothetical protein [Candidatus Dependentiae bacterium]